MTNRYNSRRYRIAAIVFLVSLLASLLLGVYGPQMFGLDGKPLWMLWTHLALGLVSVVTVPMAWRWLYRRDMN
jgi:hypothetical protein